MAERHLLGVLHNDHKYLKNLLKNPILNINLKHMTEEEQEEASIGTETESKVSENYPPQNDKEGAAVQNPKSWESFLKNRQKGTKNL